MAVATLLSADPEAPFQVDGRRALTKLRSAMTEDGRQRLDVLADRVWVRRPLVMTHSPHMRVVQEALRTGRVVVIDYVGGDGARSESRPVETVAFARDRGHWYLLAWCRRARAGRWFRLDRITAASLTTEAAPERDVRSLFGTPPGDAAPVEL